MSSQHDSSERFRLPDSVASVGDPVEGNPFPTDDPLHQVWSQATRKAEEAVCRLTADALSNRLTDGAATLIVAKFDTWAQRGLCGVWCDRAAQHYDQWLVAYANFCIDEAARSDAAAPPSFTADSVLKDLRHRLAARVHVWKAAARAGADRQPATLSPPAGVPDPGGALSCDTLGDNPYPEDDPDHHEWTKTSRSLADLTRLDSAFVSATPRVADAATVVDWLASWAVGYFDALAKARMMAIIKDKGDVGREIYRGVLEKLPGQTLRALDTLHARVSGRAKTLIAAFPGVTVSNADCLNFAADVNSRLIPEAPARLSRRRAYWWWQASLMAREHDDGQAAREEARSLQSPRAVEVASEVMTVPSTVPPLSPREANRLVSEAANEPTAPSQDPTTPTLKAKSAHRWEDIEIRFLSDLKFQAVVNGKVQEPHNYADAGFGDARRGNDTPKAAWNTLRRLAESKGVMSSADTAAEWGKVEKHIQEIRQRLRALFKLDGDPVPYRNGRYRTRFKISTSASYEE